MKIKSFLLSIVAIIIMGQVAKSQTLQWAKLMGGSQTDMGRVIAVDASGNVFIAGGFDGTADFDPSAGVFNLTSVGLNDIFISKLDASGNFVWAKRLGGTGDDSFVSISVDASANVLISGHFGGTMDFDPSAGVFNLTSAGSSDVFICKLDASGNFMWAKQLGGGSASNKSSGIAVDASGNILAIGSFSGTVDFDPGVGVFNLSSASAGSIFVSKLDPSGNFIWAKAFLGLPKSIYVPANASGDVFITGNFSGTADFDPGVGTFNMTSVGTSDTFVSKLDASGNFVWAKQMGGSSDESTVSVDASGNIFVSGKFSGTADFDPGVGVFNLTSAGSIEDIFICKLDASGNFVWAKRIGGGNYKYIGATSVDASGNVFMTGSFSGTVDFDPGVGVFNLITSYYFAVFICKLDASGNFGWAKQLLPGGGYDVGRYITVDALGNIYTTGYFSGTADFDFGDGVYNLTSAGDSDIFVHKMGQTPTGVESTWDNKITLYPIPSNGHLTVFSEEGFANASLTVRNAIGQEVFSKSYASTPRIDFDLNVTAGIYFVEIADGNKRIVRKMIKE